MEALLDEIRATFDCGIWFPTISTVLLLPDACGAIEYWGQQVRPRDRYAQWYDTWVKPHFSVDRPRFDGSVVYVVRNAMIHETTGFTRGQHGFDRIIFTTPGGIFHGSFNMSAPSGPSGEVVLQISLIEMMLAMECGVRNWLIGVRAAPDKRRELALEKLIQYRPNGLPPHFVGMPLIS